jgi:hypothetical protein
MQPTLEPIVKQLKILQYQIKVQIKQVKKLPLNLRRYRTHSDSLISNFLGTNEDDDDEEDKIVDSKTKVSDIIKKVMNLMLRMTQMIF